MVYVISQSGKALMPTSRHGKVRHLLCEGKARVVRCEPFTIQLLYDSKEYTQPVTLGVDSGTGHVGLSATTENTELFSAEVTLRRDIQELLSTRREARRTRRQRKTRYRQIFKANTLKGGIRKKNQAPYLVKGFRLLDKVLYDGLECFIFGRRSSGSFDIRKFDGTRVNAGISYKKLKFKSISNSFIVSQLKRLAAIPPTNEFVSFLADLS